MAENMMLAKVPAPVFKGDNYEMYKHQVEVWAEVCSMEKTKQVSILWLALPDKHASDIKAEILMRSRTTLRRRG